MVYKGFDWQHLFRRPAGQVTSQHATQYVYNWYDASCFSYADCIWTGTPNTQKLWWFSYQKHAEIDVEILAHSKSKTGMHCRAVNSKKIAQFTETCPLTTWCPIILSFKNDMDATLLNSLCPGRWNQFRRIWIWFIECAYLKGYIDWRLMQFLFLK